MRKIFRWGRPCCHCIYELESRDDFKVTWMVIDSHIEIPNYSVVCPACGYETYIGIDDNDCENYSFCSNLFKSIIMNRADWKGRYKIEPRARKHQ